MCFGNLIDFLLGDRFLHCLLDELGPLHFDCTGDVLNMRVSILLHLLLRLSDRKSQRHSQQVEEQRFR